MSEVLRPRDEREHGDDRPGDEASANPVDVPNIRREDVKRFFATPHGRAISQHVTVNLYLAWSEKDDFVRGMPKTAKSDPRTWRNGDQLAVRTLQQHELDRLVFEFGKLGRPDRPVGEAAALQDKVGEPEDAVATRHPTSKP